MNPTHMTKRKRELLRDYFLNASLIALLKTIGAETARTRDEKLAPALAEGPMNRARPIRGTVFR